MIRTKAQQKRAQERFNERMRLMEAERVDSAVRWRYKKLRQR